MKHMGEKISSLALNESYVGLIFRFFFIIRFYILPIYIYPSIYTLLYIFITLTFGGLYLGLNFIISHNFEGVKNISKNSNTKIDWAIAQIETSSSVGGRLLGYFHGGLHYYKIKPIVQEWCKENNIKYNYYNNIYDNIMSCYKHLHNYGNCEKLL
jgi:hypothetical protein